MMSIDARALPGGHFGQGNGSVLLSNVRCEPARDMTILECCRRRAQRQRMYCYRDDSVGVRCRDDQLVRNILLDTLTNTQTSYNIIVVTWQLQQNSTRSSYRATAMPRSFEVRCFNEIHGIKISLSNTTFTTQVGGLLQGSYYTCCVSAVCELYTAKGVCTQTETQSVFTTKITEPFNNSSIGLRASNSRSMNVVLFAVFGSIIAFLLVLSTLLCMALVYQVRKRAGKSVHTMYTHTRYVLKITR